MKMRAARLHEVATPFRLDEMEVPEPQGSDVRVRVHSCGVVPNLRNVTYYYPEWFPFLPLPPLPAIFGLDPVGVVEALGPDVPPGGLQVGQRVYVNPLRSCEECGHCAAGRKTLCLDQTMAGYFGLSKRSDEIFARYPWGGFADYMIAPLDAMVTLPDNVSDEDGARWGYLGTCYGALSKARVGPETTLLINGGTGTLGVGTALIALALGVPKIIAVARNQALLERVKALAPDRIEIVNASEGNVTERVMAINGGKGVDAVVDCLAAGAESQAMLDALMSLGKGGRLVVIGGMDKTMNIFPIHVMNWQIAFMGSCWFTSAEAQEMTALAESGALDLSAFEHKVFALEAVNDAVEAASHRAGGGFENIVVRI